MGVRRVTETEGVATERGPVLADPYKWAQDRWFSKPLLPQLLATQPQLDAPGGAHNQ